jgi:hypothetical protein
MFTWPVEANGTSWYATAPDLDENRSSCGPDLDGKQVLFRRPATDHFTFSGKRRIKPHPSCWSVAAKNRCFRG